MRDKPPANRHRTGYHPLRKLSIAMAGIRRAVLLDFSVRYKLVISLASLLIAASFENLFHFLFMLAVTGLMLVTEVVNTAVESLCDYVQPALDDRIRDIKDMVAAAAMIAIIVWGVVLLVVLYEFVTSTELFGIATRR